MKARYQYRFYPTDQQRQSLAQLFGCVRVVFNDALAFCHESKKYPGFKSLSARLTQTKQSEDREWLNAVSSVALQQSIRHLDKAYQNYFDSKKGKRNGRAVGLPAFKKRRSLQSATFSTCGFSVSGEVLNLAKVGSIKPIWSRELPSEASSVTVIKDCADRYWVSFVVEIQPSQVEPKRQSVGVDLGLKIFAALSNGDKVLSPIYSKWDRKIRKLQRKLARRQKGSNRKAVIRKRIAKLHNKVADTRKDFLHKLSTKVVSENQTIVLEDLNVVGMVKNRRLARAISLQGWSQFRTMCEAKSEKFGRQFAVIDRFEPTSQHCSDCGYQWGKLDLSVREFVCPNCSAAHCRDHNAAKNIETAGIRYCHGSKWTQRECKTTSVASLSEVSRIAAL